MTHQAEPDPRHTPTHLEPLRKPWVVDGLRDTQERSWDLAGVVRGEERADHEPTRLDGADRAADLLDDAHGWDLVTTDRQASPEARQRFVPPAT